MKIPKDKIKLAEGITMGLFEDTNWYLLKEDGLSVTPFVSDSKPMVKDGIVAYTLDGNQFTIEIEKVYSILNEY